MYSVINIDIQLKIENEVDIAINIHQRGERELLFGVWEREREWLIPFPKKNQIPQFGSPKGMKKKNIPIIREQEGNEKKTFPKFGNGEGMKKSIPIIQELEEKEKIHSRDSGTKRE